jgi:hypothetical protein
MEHAQALTQEETIMTKTFRATALKLSLATALVSSFAGVAFAHNTQVSPRAQDYVAHYDSMSAAPIITNGDFNMSGTRGRLGLGANAAHPEGPGNVSN